MSITPISGFPTISVLTGDPIHTADGFGTRFTVMYGHRAIPGIILLTITVDGTGAICTAGTGCPATDGHLPGSPGAAAVPSGGGRL